MQDVTAGRSLVVAALFLAVSAWWLGNTSLQASTGFANVPALGAQAAFVLVLGQLMLIGLLAAHGAADSWPAAASGAMSYVVPLWPLLALIWLTSELSVLSLATTQAAAFVLVIVLGSVGNGITRLTAGDEARTMLRAAVGVAAAMVIWLGRGELHTWVTA